MNHFTVYQITNLVNGKVYIGKHQTKELDDGYMGSGKLIRAAIKKYGIENFKKEILFVFETEDEMNAKEAELVTEEFIASGQSYNLCPGGQGGWGYINSEQLNIGHHQNETFRTKLREKAKKQIRSPQSNETKKKISNTLKGIQLWSGRNHTDESKERMRLAKTDHGLGSKNSQFGTMWITNGTENKKIKKDLDKIPEGWYKGRR